ncbi:DUF2267 domain-containing protein [Streptosporangium minutum]|uniref:Phosphoribosyltransferase domain-containing protein n=1 Tax=Streptosporangium minutum TaxID=569862 RepID=A0A243RFS9_9ACTN|nr:DUF2267 domain-containing protein [Streptosporangium minutum]OUC93587.1 hypothetical protein CA984_25795 [Streptosporangium minutum]
MADRLFQDRRDAGRVLAGLLGHYRGRPGVVVLGLPRGGVPVAYEIAGALAAPLDVFLVHKLGVPHHEELAMGAIAGGGVMVLNDDVVWSRGLSRETIRKAAERERRALLRRERLYRDARPMIELDGRVVIVVDDGLATGASMRAAIQALGRLRPARVVVAVPAAPASTCRELEALVDEVVCASTPEPFFAVGQSYVDFTQTGDAEVRDLLHAAARARPPGTGSRGAGGPPGDRPEEERSRSPSVHFLSDSSGKEMSRMVETGFPTFDTTVNKTNHVLRAIEEAYGWPRGRRNRSYSALRVVLHTLRDRLTVDEVARLGSQLPMLTRGIYYGSWDPRRLPIKMDAGEFMARVRSTLPDKILEEIDGDVERLVHTVVHALREHVDEVEWEGIRSVVPKDLAAVLA